MLVWERRVCPCNDLLKEARVENLDDALQSLPRLCQGARAFDVGDPALTVHMHLLAGHTRVWGLIRGSDLHRMTVGETR